MTEAPKNWCRCCRFRRLSRVRLTDQNEKTEYWNHRRGRMLATSIGGTVTVSV